MPDEAIPDGATTTDGESKPRLSWREREGAARVRGTYLDPELLPPGATDVYTTVYEPDVLLVRPAAGRTLSDGMTQLTEVAATLGWAIAQEELEDPIPGSEKEVRTTAGLLGGDEPVAEASVTEEKPVTRLAGVARTVRARISVAPDLDASKPVLRPDAWRLLREARRENISGVSLNHVMSLDAGGLNPFKGNPFKGNPFKGNPFKGNPFKGNAGGIEGYAYPGLGGRQPVQFIGPGLTPDTTISDTQRPVVAVLDTGCGTHDWFTGAMIIDPVKEYGGAIGVVDPDTDPEVHPSLGDPLDGLIDDAAGHGTFIAGIILQACPDARILPVRVADGQGVIMENDLIAALGRIAKLVEAGEKIDILNLSFSYYHESPDPAALNDELYMLLTRIRRSGTTVVCSAGNDATDRPASPASLYAWDGCDFGITAEDEKGLAPQLVVGALNPSGHSVALFSNIGTWIGTYTRGVSVLSTIPEFEGGVQADLRRDEYGRRRETLDLDDLRGGFAVWSGTSFAAPLVAGRIARTLLDAATKKAGAGVTATSTATGAEHRVEQAIKAVQAVTDTLGTEDYSNIAPAAAQTPST